MNLRYVTLMGVGLLISTANACILFKGDLTANSSTNVIHLSAELVVLGTTVCKIDRDLASQPFWLDCNNGFYAFVTNDFTTLAYAHDSTDYRIDLEKTAEKGSGNEYRWTLYRNAC